MLGPGASALRSIDRVESLERTDPEIELWPYKFRSDNQFYIVRMDIPPLNDIRVRQALQMALDLETVVVTYFKVVAMRLRRAICQVMRRGLARHSRSGPKRSRKPIGMTRKGAEALLDAAGYPRGADGIRFNMSMAYFERYDVSYAELVAGYWREIGVDTEIDVLAGGSAK